MPVNAKADGEPIKWLILVLYRLQEDRLALLMFFPNRHSATARMIAKNLSVIDCYRVVVSQSARLIF